MAAVDFLSGLEDAQVAYYLLSWSANASRLNYLARTTPSAVCRDSLAVFDKAVLAALSSTTALVLSQRQQTQATLPLKAGGLGLRPAAVVADAAYIASRAATHNLCTQIWPLHRWDATSLASSLAHGLQRCRNLLPDPSVLDSSPTDLKQCSLVRAVEQKRVQQWRAEGCPDENCRLNAYSAPGAGREYSLVPSRTLDTNLTTFEFATAVATRLGVDVMEGGVPCPLCGQLLDAGGRHAQSCMSGGDTTTEHNCVRDVFHSFCSRGGLRPEAEAPRLLAESSTVDGRRRPADVLVLPALAMARHLPDGGVAVRAEQVALDFAVSLGGYL